jgi:hypothetical protein
MSTTGVVESRPTLGRSLLGSAASLSLPSDKGLRRKVGGPCRVRARARRTVEAARTSSQLDQRCGERDAERPARNVPLLVSVLLKFVVRSFSTNSRPALRAASGRPPARQRPDGHGVPASPCPTGQSAVRRLIRAVRERRQQLVFHSHHQRVVDCLFQRLFEESRSMASSSLGGWSLLRGRGATAALVRAGSARHRKPPVRGGHEQSRPAHNNRRSRGIHRCDLGPRTRMGPGSSAPSGCREPSGLVPRGGGHRRSASPEGQGGAKAQADSGVILAGRATSAASSNGRPVDDFA